MKHYMPEDSWLTHEQLKEVIYFCKRPPSQTYKSPLVTFPRSLDPPLLIISLTGKLYCYCISPTFVM